MKSNFLLKITMTILLASNSFAQVGIGKTTPNYILDINVKGKNINGINLDAQNLDAQIFTNNQESSFVLGNTLTSGTIDLQFNSATRFEFNNNSLLPSINATSNVVSGAIDIGKFNKHFRRVYTQAIHTNDNSINGGLGINIGSGGGTNSDYNFTDFAFYPVVSNTRDLGRNGNYWRNLYFVNSYTPSDKSLKENITNNKYGLNTILAINTYKYEYINDAKNKKHYGVIAQELQKIIPELVVSDKSEDKKLAVNYLEMIPILIKAIQEQEVKIAALKNEILTNK